jgi:methanethiol S-methyltransferase
MEAAPWLVLLAVLVYGAIHSLLASLAVKRWANDRFGGAARRGYRLAYNLFAVISLLPVLALPALLPDRVLYTIPFPWAGLTLLIQALAGLALAVGVLQTGAGSFLGIRQLLQSGEAEQPLVLTGFYRCVRHPLYTAGLVILWLAPVMTANLLALVFGFSIYIVVGAVFEERKLIHEFGEAYRRYQRETPMLLPCLRLARRFNRGEREV